MMELLKTAKDRGYNPTQTCLFVLAYRDLPKVGQKSIKPIRGLDEVVADLGQQQSVLYRYQFGKANAFLCEAAAADVASQRKKGEFPLISDQRVLS